MPNEITVQHDENEQPKHLLDRSNPRSVINLVPPGIADKLEKIPPEYLEMNERELKKRVFWNELTNERSLNRLRIGFWNEYTRVQENNLSIMQIKNIYHGVMGMQQFYQSVMSNPLQCAWILTPPQDYMRAMEDMLQITTERMEEMVTAPMITKLCRCHYFCKCKGLALKDLPEGQTCICDGSKGCICPPRFDAKAAMIILEAHKAIEMRVHGAILQRVRQENLHLHAHKNLPAGSKAADSKPELQTADEIEGRIKELEAKLQNRLPPKTQLNEIIEADFTEPSHEPIK